MEEDSLEVLTGWLGSHLIGQLQQSQGSGQAQPPKNTAAAPKPADNPKPVEVPQRVPQVVPKPQEPPKTVVQVEQSPTQPNQMMMEEPLGQNTVHPVAKEQPKPRKESKDTSGGDNEKLVHSK